MLIRKSPAIGWSQVTPRDVYADRRRFLATLAGAAAAAGPLRGAAKLGPLQKSPFSTSEPASPFQTVAGYNNFYEFGTGKEQPAQLAHTLRTSPWAIAVEGEIKKPVTFDLDTIMKMAPLEERIYRLRCVEGWSIVVPWIGFPLRELINRAEPTGKAKYVAFQSLYDSKQMPAAKYGGIPFPYVEGLRMDEAMHPLTILAVGLYGEVMPKQNGAPVRLVVPWKYGFKSIKSIVKIRFVEKQPPTTWNLSNAREYGFFSNVNPEVDHPRWSQSKERRLGEFLRRPTLKFNGYGEHVAQLYQGMDLRKFY